jgi:hypothetical protein
MRRLAGLRSLTLRQEGPDLVRVAGPLHPRRRRYRLADPEAGLVATGTLRLWSPDPAALVRLVASGLLTGEVRRLRLRLESAPDWLLAGVRPPRLARTCQRFNWRRRGRGLTIDLRWSTPYDLSHNLAGLLAAVLRTRPWEQASGPVYRLDRAAWLAAGSPWPQGRLAGAPPAGEVAAAGRGLGPYHAVSRPDRPLPPPILTAVANPHGRRLVGAAARYRLVGGSDGPAVRDQHGRAVLRLDPAAGGEASRACAPRTSRHAWSTWPASATRPWRWWWGSTATRCPGPLRLARRALGGLGRVRRQGIGRTGVEVYTTAPPACSPAPGRSLTP